MKKVNRFLGMLLVVGVAFVGFSALPIASLHASTMAGEVVELDGLNSLTATGVAQVKGNTGKFAGVGLAMAGMGAAGLMGAWAVGMIGALSGFGIAFAPSIYSQAVDSAPAATLGALSTAQSLVSTEWWAPLTIVPYLGLWAVEQLTNPVGLFALALVVGGGMLLKQRRRSRLVTA